LITDVVNICKTVDATKSTENYVHTEEIKIFGDSRDNKTIKIQEETLITDVVNVHEIVDTPKSTCHEHTNEIKGNIKIFIHHYSLSIN